MVVEVNANIELDLERVFQAAAEEYCNGITEDVDMDDVFEYVERSLTPLSGRGRPGVTGPSDGPSINGFGGAWDQIDEALENWKEAHR